MYSLNRNILTIIFLVCVSQGYAGQIWSENFSKPGKGIWGDSDGVTIHSDFSEMTQWSLRYNNIKLAAPDDYAKTVPTSGGRFEVCDVDGIVVWLSEWIPIKNAGTIALKLLATETGSGANETAKNLKSCYRLNGGPEILFGKNGVCAGNWGSALAEQEGLSGDSIQIVVYLANSYSSDKVILDEVEVTGNIIGIVPPFVIDIKIPAPDTLAIFFNEPINTQNLEKEMFAILSDAGQVVIRNLYKISENQVKLEIEPSPVAELSLVVSGVADLAGNVTAADTFAFLYLPPVLEHDIVFNELMADPAPPQGLPNAEFIELFNRAQYPIELKGWILRIDETEKTLGQEILLPGKFLILTNTSSADSFTTYGRALAVPGFPSLKNSGSSFSLISDKNVEIDQVSYFATWFVDSEKQDGGWSLERIDPNRFCGTKSNWQYSLNPSGGTPGKANSGLKNNPDNLVPIVLSAEATSPIQIEIRFSEPIDSTLLKIPGNYDVSEGFGPPDSITIVSTDHVKLNFNKSFAEDKLYTLRFPNLADECGNLLSTISTTFSWSVARVGDIVINEVLPNPFPEGTDFVELYNLSEKWINLSQLWLSNGKDTVALIPSNKYKNILAPGGFAALTKDSAKAVAPYLLSCTEYVFGIPGFPTIYNNEGEVVILNRDLEAIDRFVYNGDLFTGIITDIEGISLERISAEKPANDPENWLPASESVGFATPGCKNSQNLVSSAASVEFSPESFSPNLDGYNDHFEIKYKLNRPGYFGNARIYDIAGRTVASIAANINLGTEGAISWNGNDETGSRLPVGPYIVVFEMFDLHGSHKTYKDVVVLTFPD